MNDGDLALIRKRLKRWIVLFKVPYLDLDDVCQGVIELMLRRNQVEPNLTKFYFIDYLRMTWGRKDRKNHVARHNLAYDLAMGSPDFVLALSPDPMVQMEARLMLAQSLAQLPERDREIMLLFLKGFSHGDIGKKFGFTSSRSSQIVLSILAQMRVLALT